MENKKFRSAIISSTVEICSVHPLDVYKVLYQKNKSYSFLNYLKESLQFKYRGFIYRFIGIIPMRTTFWISQYHGENIFYNKICKNKLYNKINNYICISLYSSFFQTLVDAPIENFKIRKILNNQNTINNYIFFNNIYEEIYKYYYRGFIFNYLRNFIFVGFVYS